MAEANGNWTRNARALARLLPRGTTVESKLLDRLRRAIRVRNDSIRTERSYVDWVYRFILFHSMRHPVEMGAPEINAFLSYLATDLNVAASTQATPCRFLQRRSPACAGVLRKCVQVTPAPGRRYPDESTERV